MYRRKRHKEIDVSDIVYKSIEDCIYFENDCINLLDKSRGSYVLNYDNKEQLINKIKNTKWVKSNKSTEDILIATGKVKGYCGIYHLNKLNDRDIIFGLPGKTLKEYIPVVVKDKGISLPFMSIVLYKINNQYRYLTLAVGNNYKYNIVETDKDLEFKLIGKQALLDSGCNNVQRIDPSIASNYLVQTALRNELSNNGSILATLYKEHSINTKSYCEFIDTLNNMKWTNVNGSYTLYYAKGISGYSKYPKLTELDENANIRITEVDNSLYPKLVVDESKIVSDIITLRLFVYNNDVRIIGCYFGVNEKDKLIKTNINWDKDYTLKELMNIGFVKARVNGYSSFDELNLETILNFIHPWLEDSDKFIATTPEYKLRELTDFINCKDKKVFYKSITLDSEKELQDQEKFKNLGFITSCTSSFNIALALNNKKLNASSNNNITCILEIESERWFNLGGVEKEVIVCNPKVIGIKNISFRR